jgi:LPXTG-site transpeptidase (sortase) family protein
MPGHHTGEGGRRRLLAWLAAVVALAGVVLVVMAVAAQESAPQPPRSVGRIAMPSHTRAGRLAVEPATTHPLGPSRPVRLRIPAIGVDTSVIRLGLAPNGTLAVPQPGPDLDKAAWFENSPTPGQPGPSVIEGHVDSEQGPSVFFRLGDIRPGDRIRVRRADGTRVTFTVTAVRDFQKAHFPTRLVYGDPDLGEPQLRLITCGDFDEKIHHHVGNEVVFARLTHVRR